MGSRKSEKVEMYGNCMSVKMNGRIFPTWGGRWKFFSINVRLCSDKAKDEKEAIKQVEEKHSEWRL